MKIFISIVLMLLLSFQLLFKTVLVMDYTVNKKYIAATYCVNIGKPQLCCEGKCYLQKKIDQSNETERNTIPCSLKEHQSVYCLSVFDFSFIPVHIFNVSCRYELLATAAIVSVSSSFFHPPPRV